MKLPVLCIRQPVLAIVLSLILVVLGIVGFSRSEIRFFPALTLPQVTVSTSYDGADSTIMESQITTPLENAIAGVQGIQSISSSSNGSSSNITVLFQPGGDFESQAGEVRDKVAAEVKNLPVDADPPVVTVGTVGAVVVYYGITQPGKSSAEIRDYVNHNIVPVIRQLPGVGGVYVNGAWDYAMRIWLDPAKMVAFNVTVTDIQTALNANNIFFPAGSIRGENRTYAIVSDTQLKSVDEFANIIIRQNDQGTVRLKDVAEVGLGYTTPFPTPLWLGDQEGVVLNVQPLQTANPIAVAAVVKKVMEQLKTNLPSKMQSVLSYDLSTFLQGSINETFISIGEAIILVILVVVVFLGSLRAASIPIVTIPVSMISVFFIIYMLGNTINVMSLLAMVLAIGLVVDDAIVMLENIYRHVETGMTPMDAAIKGSQEISNAIIAMSITLVAVYAPAAFAEGFTAKLFQEFAYTLAGAVLISGFIALTLSPMMCSRLLKPGHIETPLAKKWDSFFEHLANTYRYFLRGCLKAKHAILLAIILIGVFGYGLSKTMSSEFLPQDDYGVINFSVQAPEGSTVEYVEQYLGQIKTILNHVSSIKSWGYQLLSNDILTFITLKPWKERHLTVQQLVIQLNAALTKIPGLTMNAYVPDVIDYGEQGSDLNLNIVTSGTYEDLLSPVTKMMVLLHNYPGVVDIGTDLTFNSQQYLISINRDLVAESGVNLQDLANTIQAMMSGNHWTNVQSGGISYSVLVQMNKKYLKHGFLSLDQLYVRGGGGTNTTTLNNMIPLSSLVTLTPRIWQGNLRHFNRLRSGLITARLAPGYTESDAIHFVEQNAPLVMTDNTRYAFSGKTQQFLQSSGSLLTIIFLAFIFIYLILSAQFGSFIDPFIILFAVPLSIVGAMFFLKLGGGTLNLYSQIGMVTLVGLISKHGILITQFINTLRNEGKALEEAIVMGASIRLRPILMTTAAMVFGALPLALASGPGAAGRAQIGWVIVGGLVCGTFFSLIAVPVAYSYLGVLKRRDASQEKEE